MLQSLGPGAHIVSVNDVYGGTFRYMNRVAKENQGLETTFLDLENADDETIIASIRPNTKVSDYILRRYNLLTIHAAYLDRVSYQPYSPIN